MIKTTRASLTVRIAVLVASLACASLLAGTVAAGAATIVYAPESYSVYEQQLNSGKVRAVTINKRLRSLRVTLDDGSYVLARYKPKEEKKAAAALEAKHVPVVVLTSTEASKELKGEPKKKHAKHKLRYIAAGVLIVVIIIVAAVLLIRRRRYRDDY
jgi:CHASE1-domain containing sensor protein